MTRFTLNILGITPAKAGVHPEISVSDTHLRMDSGLRRNDAMVGETFCQGGIIP